MKVILIGIYLFLVGCTTISYKTTPDVPLNHPGHDGYASWIGLPGIAVLCQIEIMPESAFPNKECYQEVLKHEERHCREGAFHPPENWGYPDLHHCPWSINYAAP
jgi:hypothetical protein